MCKVLAEGPAVAKLGLSGGDLVHVFQDKTLSLAPANLKGFQKTRLLLPSNKIPPACRQLKASRLT